MMINKAFMINMDAGVCARYVIYRRFRPPRACFGCGSVGFQHSSPIVMAKPGDYFSFLNKLTYLLKIFTFSSLPKTSSKLKNFSSLMYMSCSVDLGYQIYRRH